MKTPEQIFDEAIQAKGLDIVSVKDADLYEAGLDAIKQALSIADVVGQSEQLCQTCNGSKKLYDKVFGVKVDCPDC
jgi:hypothetical protein